jgi:Circularly permutated YpsA SLOG family
MPSKAHCHNLCALEKKPYIIIDARQITEPGAAAEAVFKFVEEHGIRVLNVAGPQLSGWAEEYGFIRHFMPHPSRCSGPPLRAFASAVRYR